LDKLEVPQSYEPQGADTLDSLGGLWNYPGPQSYESQGEDMLDSLGGFGIIQGVLDKLEGPQSYESQGADTLDSLGGASELSRFFGRAPVLRVPGGGYA